MISIAIEMHHYKFCSLVLILGVVVKMGYTQVVNVTKTISDDFSICNAKTCVRKCCGETSGIILDEDKGKYCEITNATTLHPFLLKNNIHVLYNQSCNETYQFSLHAFVHTHNVTFYENGMVNVPMLKDVSPLIPMEEFCIDHFNGEPGIFVCIDKRKVAVEARLYLTSGMIISMPFLLATFLVYAILPDRNVHQRALMFYVLTLCISYILLVTINLSTQLEQPWCEIFAYSTLFFFMVSFFWMNVICFDIWYTFSGGRGFVGSKRSSERRRLLLYSAYAWGLPILHVVVVIVMQKVLPLSSEHNPGVGITKCFIGDGWPNLWYFYGEAAILVIANIIFFLRTAFKIRQVKKETSMLKQNDSKRHAYEKDKQKFNLYLKLLFAMGVNWSMEVISWLVNWQTSNKYTEVWYVTDFFNAVYGVFIFFIFVFKKKIWKLLQKRYYNFVGKPHLAHTMTSSNTRTSHYSSTNYSTADTNLSDRPNGARPEEVVLQRVT